MSMMTDPMNALLSLQEELDRGIPLNPCELDQNYKMISDQPNGRQRFSYAKIIGSEVQALSLFAVTDSVDGVACFNIGYAVKPRYRGRRLGIEAVIKGLEELKNGFGRSKIEKFYIEAVVGVTNDHSIKVAESIFAGAGGEIKDHHTGEPALHYIKLVEIR